MNKKEIKQYIADFYQAWKDRDEEKIVAFYDKNLRAYSDFSEITFEDIMNRLQFSREKFSEANYIIEDLFIDEEEGKVAIRMKQRHVRKDGQLVKWEAIMLYKIVNRKITELWMSFFPNANYLDNTW